MPASRWALSVVCVAFGLCTVQGRAFHSQQLQRQAEECVTCSPSIAVIASDTFA
jgi:hypothetical protein